MGRMSSQCVIGLQELDPERGCSLHRDACACSSESAATRTAARPGRPAPCRCRAGAPPKWMLRRSPRRSGPAGASPCRRGRPPRGNGRGRTRPSVSRNETRISEAWVKKLMRPLLRRPRCSMATAPWRASATSSASVLGRNAPSRRPATTRRADDPAAAQGRGQEAGQRRRHLVACGASSAGPAWPRAGHARGVAARRPGRPGPPRLQPGAPDQASAPSPARGLDDHALAVRAAEQHRAAGWRRPTARGPRGPGSRARGPGAARRPARALTSCSACSSRFDSCELLATARGWRGSGVLCSVASRTARSRRAHVDRRPSRGSRRRRAGCPAMADSMSPWPVRMTTSVSGLFALMPVGQLQAAHAGHHEVEHARRRSVPSLGAAQRRPWHRAWQRRRTPSPPGAGRPSSEGGVVVDDQDARGGGHGRTVVSVAPKLSHRRLPQIGGLTRVGPVAR